MRTLRSAGACLMMMVLLFGSNVPPVFGELEGMAGPRASSVGSKLVQGLDWILTTRGKISLTGQPLSNRLDGQSGVGLVTVRGDGNNFSLSSAELDPASLTASAREDAADSLEPCLSSSCANIAGVWKGYETGYLDCTVLGEEFSFYVNAPSQLVTITQNGCSVYYTLSGYPQYPRTGTITGNSVYITGAMIDPGDVGYPYTISQNSISGTGVISANYIYGNASGAISGSVLLDGVWYSLSCSAYTYFNITRMTPVQATLISPSETLATNKPTYQWHPVSNATSYQLWVNDTSGTAVQKWYSASDAGCGSGTGTCSATPDLQVGGESQWWIQTYNKYGTGPWSDGLRFSAPSLAPDHPVMLVSPSGTIATSAPTYIWEADPSATWYLLQVVDSGGERIKKWYSAAAAGCEAGTGTCSVTPDMFVREGAATWKVQTWNKYGYGPWSASMEFTAPTPEKPKKIALLSPSGTISTTLPSYSWSPAANASWYLLEVHDSRGTPIKKWYTAAAAGCEEGAGTCAVTPDILVAGVSEWWILPWNPVGNGDWSSSLTFTAPIPAKPGPATLLSPSGTITTNKPTYTWNPVKDATWYYLWVKDGKGNVITKWYSASEAGCAGGLGSCSATPATSLAQGTAEWWLRPWNALGNGPWSSGSFAVNTVSSGGKP